MPGTPITSTVGRSRIWLLLLLALTQASGTARGSVFPPETFAEAQTSPPTSAIPDSLSATATDIAPRLQEARECLKNGDYERAIDLLRTAIERARDRLPELRDAYLLLIKTYVLRGNEYKLEIQGRPTSELYYSQARQTITECLNTKELRHTLPVPVSEYPPEMTDLFAEVRREIFGSLRVADLAPPDAIVLCDADTLRAALTDSLPGDTDLPVGPHLMVVRRAGYRDLTEEVHISPGSVLELRYRLDKKHDKRWYALRSGVISGVVGGAAWAILGGKDKAAAGPQDLPGPPPPPQ